MVGEDGINAATAPASALVGLALDALPDSSVMVFDTDLRFVLCRGGALAANAFDPEQIEGLLAEEALAPARWAFYQPLYAAALRGEASSLEVDSPDGARRYAIRVGPLADGSGRILGGVALATDVTDRHHSVRALAASEERFRLAMYNAGVGTALSGQDGQYVEVNDAMCRMLGYTREALTGLTFVQVSHPDDAPASVAAFDDLQAGRRDIYRTRKRYLRADGHVVWSDVTVSAVRDGDGAFRGTITQLVDVTAEVEEHRALSDSEERFRVAVRNSGVAMSLADADGVLLDVNPTMCAFLGRTESQIKALTWRDVTHPDDVADDQARIGELLAGTRETYRGVARYLLPDGDVRVGDLTRSAVRVPGNGSLRYVISQIVDVTAEAEARSQLEYQAGHDNLTGLRNRTWILDTLDTHVRAARRTGIPVAVLFIDVDNFKIVNDSLGHAAGDEVLTAIAGRIAGVLRPPANVGRFGGDEFVVIVPEAREPLASERIAARISTAVGVELTVAGHRIVPSVSIGIAVSGPDSTAASLLRDGDSALFRAKSDGRSRWRFFDDAMHAEAVQRLTCEDELRRGLEAGDFTVHYQPIVQLADGRVVGHEALVRWQHHTRGLLAPAEFLTVAEESGLICDIGQVVLNQVCALLAADHHKLPGPISVNVSAVQLRDPGWLTAFTDTLARHRVDPARIIIEVTETAVLSLTDTARADLTALRGTGVGIHLDDFGTGFSSISVLRDLPVTGLKLDRSFVHDLHSGGPTADALTAGLAGLVSGLQLRGIAEGIETRAQATTLLAQGWTHGQGYLYGRPTPVLATTSTDTHTSR